LAEFCHRFYSYSTHIIEVELTGKFHMSNIGLKKFWMLTGAEDEKKSAE
jgi:hypothetical protein